MVGRQWEELLSNLLEETAVEIPCKESTKREELVMVFDLLETTQRWAGRKKPSWPTRDNIPLLPYVGSQVAGVSNPWPGIFMRWKEVNCLCFHFRDDSSVGFH